MLPYLAWAFSVDRWDQSWSDAVKRSVIKASRAVHQQKGTIAAIKGVISPFGYSCNVVEWFNSGGDPGTFYVDVFLADDGADSDVVSEMTRLINDAKPASRTLTAINLTLIQSGLIYIGAASYDGDTMTILPG